jgi:ARS binding protein 2
VPVDVFPISFYIFCRFCRGILNGLNGLLVLKLSPGVHLKMMISDATKRQMERQYHPSQQLSPRQPQIQQNGGNTPQIPLRPPLLTSNGNGTHQGNRGLPTREVTDANFDDAYVAFIMYCNPTIPLDTDTTELRKIFRAPPKSDGKNFSTFTLFELIRKLDQKELKTWAQLALELGVEPPALDKGQSAQKVQQYAVRLKVRWLAPYVCRRSCDIQSSCKGVAP